MASKSDNMTIVDVYELASNIGHQFENLINLVGKENMGSLIALVINSLEHLESLTQKLETENSEICDLRFAVERLKDEKKIKAEEKIKFDQELEQIEESWKNEIISKDVQIRKIQEENQRLLILVSKNNINESLNGQLIEDNRSLEEEFCKLKRICEQQKQEARIQEHNIREHINNNQLLEKKVKQLLRQTSCMKKKASQLEQIAQEAIIERANFQSEMGEKEMRIAVLEKKIKKILFHGDIDLEDQASLSEMERLLNDRNKLRVKVDQLQKQIFFLTENRKIKFYEEEEENDKEAPVQGPINKEPEEKINPFKFQTKSGIKKLFEKLIIHSSSSFFSSNSSSNSSVFFSSSFSSSPKKLQTGSPSLHSNFLTRSIAKYF